ncbi:MAG: hypothetical protein DI549_16195 [Ancylobacter novellus]|uniref:Integrase catalytic domain-containing protein n=1 Tax=Ancylobacter novellus TaxID=921 RepID=A0A2W5QQ35_ANCNO|nr:MAG: hypothetical protein DI549_16195 [Ancylobacter novellus]
MNQCDENDAVLRADPSRYPCCDNRRVAEARIVLKDWRQHYDDQRPYSSLGYRPPAPPGVVWPPAQTHAQNSNVSATRVRHSRVQASKTVSMPKQ